MVAFFVNPPEGAEHGLKLIESKIRHHIYFKNFWKIATFMLSQKKISSQNSNSRSFLESWNQNPKITRENSKTWHFSIIKAKFKFSDKN